MLVEFKMLPDNARVWVYQASRKLSESEVEIVASKTELFLQQWTAHGQDLEAAFELRYNRFIVFGLNQEMHLLQDAVSTLLFSLFNP